MDQAGQFVSKLYPRLKFSCLHWNYRTIPEGFESFFFCLSFFLSFFHAEVKPPSKSVIKVSKFWLIYIIVTWNGISLFFSGRTLYILDKPFYFWRGGGGQFCLAKNWGMPSLCLYKYRTGNDTCTSSTAFSPGCYKLY